LRGQIHLGMSVLARAGAQEFLPPDVDGMFQIVGPDAQVLEVAIAPGSYIITEPGTMMHMGNTMKAKITIGGCCDAVKRSAIAHESFFRVKFTNEGQQTQVIGLTPHFPGKIVPVNVSDFPNGVVISSSAFMATVSDSIKFKFQRVKKPCTCVGGGHGLLLNKLTGNGVTFLNAGGTIIMKTLAAGEELLADTRCTLAWDANVDFSVRLAGACCGPMCCCGGQGFFNTVMKGPGVVWMQAYSYDRLVTDVADNVWLPRKGARKSDSGGGGIDIVASS